jgi:hypothetical protein
MFEYLNIFVMVDIISAKCTNFLFPLDLTISLCFTVHNFIVLQFKIMLVPQPLFPVILRKTLCSLDILLLLKGSLFILLLTRYDMLQICVPVGS